MELELKLVGVSKPDDGSAPAGVEDAAGAQARHDLLRQVGYER